MTIALAISGCSWLNKPDPIEISAEPVDKPELTLPNADEVNLRDVEWRLVTEDNFDSQIEEIRESGRPVVFFALTDKGYENLSLNISDIRALVQQQEAIIAAYKNYYTESQKALDGAVKSDSLNK